MGLDMYLREVRYLGHFSWQTKPKLAEESAAVEVNGAGEVTRTTFSYEHEQAEAAAAAAGLQVIENGGVEVKVTVLYWRKANQIHGWFVEHCQAGTDDCGSYRVEPEQLLELRNLCQEVLDKSELAFGEVTNGYRLDLVEGEVVRDPIIEPGFIAANPQVAHELLPPTSGFFFGSDEINEYYLDDLKRTVEGIDRVLAAKHEDSWFEYQSSW